MIEMEHGKIAVNSKEELADFIESLRDDFVQDPSSWENPTLDRFLDAMAAWVRAMDHFYRNIGEEPPVYPSWSMLAEILAVAKDYE